MSQVRKTQSSPRATVRQADYHVQAMAHGAEVFDTTQPATSEDAKPQQSDDYRYVQCSLIGAVEYYQNTHLICEMYSMYSIFA